jgi:hypothetical protein
LRNTDTHTLGDGYPRDNTDTVRNPHDLATADDTAAPVRNSHDLASADDTAAPIPNSDAVYANPNSSNNAGAYGNPNANSGGAAQQPFDPDASSAW